jgi:hypothetical protein
MRRLFLSLLILMIAVPLAAQNAPRITAFGTSVASVSRDALLDGSARVPVAWTVADRPETANLAFEQVLTTGVVNIELPRDDPFVPDSGEGLVAPIAPADPTATEIILRLRLFDTASGTTLDASTLTIPVTVPEPAIETFSTGAAAVNAATLHSGEARVPVSWSVVDRPAGSVLAFEQVFADGSAQNIELPRDDTFVPDSGQGIVAPVAPPRPSDSITLRLRLIQGEETLAAETLTLPLGVPPELIGLEFDVQPRQITEGDTVTISANAPGATVMLTHPALPPQITGVEASIHQVEDASGFQVRVPEGVQQVTFYLDGIAYPPITIEVRCRANWLVEVPFEGGLARTCPDSTAEETDARFQPFEGGFMLRIERDTFAFFETGGGLVVTQVEGQPIEDTPPDNRVAPDDRFEALWSADLVLNGALREAPVRTALGWATDGPQTYTARVQSTDFFEAGGRSGTLTMLTLPDGRIIAAKVYEGRQRVIQWAEG